MNVPRFTPCSSHNFPNKFLLLEGSACHTPPIAAELRIFTRVSARLKYACFVEDGLDPSRRGWTGCTGGQAGVGLWSARLKPSSLALVSGCLVRFVLAREGRGVVGLAFFSPAREGRGVVGLAFFSPAREGRGVVGLARFSPAREGRGVVALVRLLPQASEGRGAALALASVLAFVILKRLVPKLATEFMEIQLQLNPMSGPVRSGPVRTLDSFISWIVADLADQDDSWLRRGTRGESGRAWTTGGEPPGTEAGWREPGTGTEGELALRLDFRAGRAFRLRLPRNL